MPAGSHRPDRDGLYEIASSQEGHFSTAQAASAGYSPQLLAKHLHNGGILRVRRGVYRLVHYPAGEHEDLVAIWLWSGREAVFSHQTALALHDLSDSLPSETHVTLPATWAHRRLRIPGGIALHHAGIAQSERSWSGPVPATSVRRTLLDCVSSQVEPQIVRDALEEALARGMIDRESVPAVIDYLRPYFSARRRTPGSKSAAGSSQVRESR